MSTMRAVMLRRFGGAEELVMEQVERPVPAPGQVLVRVASTSVNPADVKAREGKVPMIVDESKLPIVLGWDLAGTIEAVGDGVSDWHIGDEVFGCPIREAGSYAEYAAIDVTEIARAPQAMSLEDAGGVPLAGLTAWQGLFNHGRLKAGQRVLIHGGSGGVGHLAVQFAHAIGATVFATASGRNRQLLLDLGADTSIDYEQQRFEDVATDIDLVLDLIGGETQRRSWSVLKPDGALMSAVETPDEKDTKGRRCEWYFADANHHDIDAMREMIDTGKVRLVVSARFALQDIAAAHTRLNEGVRGKVVISVAPDA